APLLAQHVGRGDLVVIDLRRHADEKVRVPDGDARGHADAVHREGDGVGAGARAFGRHHSPSSNLFLKSASIASMAATSSGPSVSSSTDEPIPAASIITPMMLFAFTRRPLREIQMPLLNFAASAVSLADARAWSPSLLEMVIIRFCISAGIPCARCLRPPRRAPFPPGRRPS